ncbi:MAG: hypothetical protein OER21_01660 [Gemmatimonadota bacterium]|nr:hypothetical protein [Gemmatimonadota bacterium]
MRGSRCRSVAGAAPVLTALALATAGPAAAQTASTCFVVVDSTGGVGRQIDVGGGYVRWFQGGGIWAHCRGQDTFWYSDSVAWFQDFDRFDMLGRVNFRDATAELTADRASYFLRDERLDATGNARLRNRITGSVLRGPNVQYYRRVLGIRDTTELRAGGRPTIEYRSEGDPPDAEPYLIIADRVSFRGNTAARGWGRVTIDRSDFHGAGDSAFLDTGQEVGRLMGRASVAGGEASGYRLVGQDIRYRLRARALTWVQAEGEADATSGEWRVTSDTVQFDIMDDRVQGGAAWGSARRPVAVSARNTILADSLAITAPAQLLREVRGIGAARAASRQDSLDTDEDWVAGDTVVARFAPGRDGGTTLAAIEAAGAARARYRVYASADRSTTPDISYSRGDRIRAQFRDDRLLRVDIAGKSDGVYLEAPRRQP